MPACETASQVGAVAAHPRNRRSEPRYVLPAGRLKAMITLLKDHAPASVTIENISNSGAMLSFDSDVSPKTLVAVEFLIKPTQDGKFVPAKLDYKGGKIPAHIHNFSNGKNLGVRISDHPQLSALAANGRLLFRSLVLGAAQFKAPEVPFEGQEATSREMLGDEILNFLDKDTFTSNFGYVLANNLHALIPSLNGRVSGLEEALVITGFFLKFLEALDRDYPLLVGAELCKLRRNDPETSLAELLSKAVRTLCEEGRLFLSAEELADAERWLETRHFKKRAETDLKKLPSKHPVAELINIRFEAFTRQVFFVQSLAPYARLRYVEKFVPQYPDMARMMGEDDRLSKVLFSRWVQNALNDFSSSSRSGKIGDLFKQAMYEYMLAKKSKNITSADIFGLLEGKLAGQYAPIRDNFLSAICRLIDETIQGRFDDYKADVEEEMSKAGEAKKAEQNLSRMAPLELAKRFLWPKIVQMGFISQIHREVARALVPAERVINISELGNAVVLSQPSYDEIVASARSNSKPDFEPRDLFDVLDLHQIYGQRTEKGGNAQKSIFAMYVDMMQPVEQKEAILGKVVFSAQWGRYYILKKSASHFAKIFGQKAGTISSMVLDKMLTTVPSGDYV
ncbi:MAG: PilZ domain-containing protein [Nitrospinae bacterium]|nr:PilZ domain-containing protein [Nitrospinota bacterium]